MVRMVNTDLRKLFGDYHIYACMAGMAFVYMLVHLQTVHGMGDTFGIVNAYKRVAGGSEVMLVAFLLSIVGGSFLHCAEEKHGYLGLEIQRVGAGVYTASKLFVSLVGGFCTKIAGDIMFLLGISAHKLFLTEAVSFQGEKWEYMVWMMLFSALRCGVLSAIGFLITTNVANYYIGMSMPIILYYGILQVEYWFSVFFPIFPDSFYFSDIYNSYSYTEDGFQQKFVFAVLYTACISVVMYRMARARVERRMEHA